jgi:hypothetical protein
MPPLRSEVLPIVIPFILSYCLLTSLYLAIRKSLCLISKTLRERKLQPSVADNRQVLVSGLQEDEESSAVFQQGVEQF